MKKILGIIAIAGVMVACNNETSSETTKTDTTTTVTPTAPDTTQVVTTTEVSTDTLHKEGEDTTKHN